MKYISYCLILLCTALVQISCNTNKHTLTAHENVKERIVLSNPHQHPYYLNGGKDGLMNDLYAILSKTAPVTQECVSGRAYVSFVISEDGLIDHDTIKVIRNRSVPEDYIDAAIEAIKKLGRFEPGKLNGTPKRVAYTIPVKYPIPLDCVTTSE